MKDIELLTDLESTVPSVTQDEVPIFATYDTAVDLPRVTDDAVSRQISRIQSRRSQASVRNATISETNEYNSDLTSQKSYDTISNDKRFDRFSLGQKRICVIMASIAGFLAPMSSLAYLPAVPEIADRFNTTGEVINISNAIYCIFMSISPCIFSPCSDIYGRKPTFVFCALMFTVATILVGVSQNLAMFYIFRCLSAMFGTCFFSVGAHIIGDLFIPTQRGTYMAWLIAGSQVGNSFGAVLGGIIVQFTSWRVIFYVLAGIGGIVAGLGVFFLPETSLDIKYQRVLAEAKVGNPKKRFVFIPINPFSVIKALKFPNLFIDGWISMMVLYAMFSLLTPIRYVMSPRFNLTKPVYSGLFYLPSGMGYIIGSMFGGKWADYNVKKYIKIRGRRVPEDRLRAILIPMGIVYPGCMLIYGWSIQKEVGGMAVPIIFMFFSGLAQTVIFPASNTYCVDSMPEIGGDGIGSSYFSRYLAAAVASATCLRSIEAIGVGWTCTISAFALWSGFLCGVVLVKWGEQLRINALIKYGLRDPEPKEISTKFESESQAESSKGQIKESNR